MLASNPAEDLKGYLNRWAAVHLSCKPADRSAAEDSVCLAYRAAGLKAPERIVWCGGPVDIAAQLATVSTDAVIGPNVRAELYCELQKKVSTLAEIFWKEVILAATKFAPQAGVRTASDEYETCKRVAEGIHRLVRCGTDDHFFRVGVRARHVMLRLRGRPRLLPRWSFDEIAIGPSQFASIAVYEYLHDELPWKDVTAPLRGLWRIGASAGWIVPHERVCWISDRPSLLRTDTRGRLHCADGPALSYRDGWSACAWKGVPVPAWMIEHPERITCATLANTFDPILRNSMIDMMTPKRFVQSGIPLRVSEDECGVLWRKQWRYRGTTVGSWTAVEVVNGTAAPDGTRKHYFLRVPTRMQTAREAVAWTYGLTAQEYAQLEIRT